jgi:uroporphyrinogen-III synthase
MLEGRRIAVPESRELDLFTRMLERQGATAIRCPLVSIHDVEDSAPVEAWLQRLADGQHDVVILYTGEGPSRLLGFARRKDMEEEVVGGLHRACKVARGPKPAKILRSIGLAPDVMAEAPTTAGLIATLSSLDLKGKRIGVQLYPGGEQVLSDFLDDAGARSDPILCYRYASDEEDGQVLQFIEELASGTVDLIAFTSTAQVRRLQEVSRQFGKAGELDAAMRQTLIAAIGPVTAEAVEKAGWPVGAMPQDSFHLKPLITTFARRLRQDTHIGHPA